MQVAKEKKGLSPLWAMKSRKLRLRKLVGVDWLVVVVAVPMNNNLIALLGFA